MLEIGVSLPTELGPGCFLKKLRIVVCFAVLFLDRCARQTDEGEVSVVNRKDDTVGHSKGR